MKTARLVGFLLIVLAAGCGPQPNDQGAVAATPPNPAPADLPGTPCTPTDQDAYVWRPARLQVLRPCERAVGTVTEVSRGGEVDGDMHVHLRLDAPYQALLTPGNAQVVEGYLVVEAVCQFPPPQIMALRLCASDPDPYLGPYPRVGDHIWVEGRYVLDLGHHGLAELHPLYRWGLVSK